MTELRALIAEQVADLERQNDEVWEAVERPRLEGWQSGAELDLGPEGTRLRRYEAAADRLFRSAWTKLERLRKERDLPMIRRSERDCATEPAPRSDLDPPAVPRSAPVPTAPSSAAAPRPMRPEPGGSAPLLLDDSSPVLDFWIGGPPRPPINAGGLLQNKTNPAPGLPASAGGAGRRRNLP